MSGLARLTTVAAVIAAAVGVTFALGAGTAHACSCRVTDAIDDISLVDAVFIGTPVEPVDEAAVEAHEEVWRFEVDGVVTGDVAEDQLVVGSNEQSTCGPYYGPDTGQIVVYAFEHDGLLHAAACLGASDVDGFVARLDEPPPALGNGPPAALRLGAVRNTDIAVLDADGRTLAGARLGIPEGATAAVCPGTTVVALLSSGPDGRVTTVDLVDLTVISEYDVSLPTQWAALACYDGGSRLAVASTTNTTGTLQVSTITSDGTDTHDAGPAFAGAAFHRDGTVILMPVDGIAGLRVLQIADLSPAISADVALPARASIADAAVSPDGSQLAMLATLDGTPAVGRVPSTHVIVVDVADGIPVDGTAEVRPLDPASIALPEGPALRIDWVDDTTWVIEHVGNFNDWLEFVDTEGTQLTAPFDVGEGSGLAPVRVGGAGDTGGQGRVMRRHLNGIRVVSIDGSSTDGDPVPEEGFDRFLRLTSLTAAAPFTPSGAMPSAFAISEPRSSGTPATASVPPASVADGAPTAQPVDNSPDARAMWVTATIFGALAVSLLTFAAIQRRSSRRGSARRIE